MKHSLFCAITTALFHKNTCIFIKNLTDMIEFAQDACSNYQHRTFLNIELSEATLVFAVDLTTPGEKCTKNYASVCEKKLFSFVIGENGRLDNSNRGVLSSALEYIKNNNITILNIAGNGIYTFSAHGITQQRVNELVYNVLKYLIDNGCNLKKVRSGGQTGADEAGLVAGDKLGLETVSFCPKGWRFRTADGKDVKSEELYKARFKVEGSTTVT